MSTMAMSAVSAESAGMASAVVNSIRQVGQVFGVAVLGALVYATLPQGGGTNRELRPDEQILFVTGLHHAVWLCGLLLLGAATLSLPLFTSRVGVSFVPSGGSE
jgi:MFS transporter, DHA2 family, methylenomycin A resistance protein